MALLRLEDIDPERCKPAYAEGLLADLAWLGLEWDRVDRQSAHAAAHQEALIRLAGSGDLYACRCSRARLKNLGRLAPDGGFAYDNHCRSSGLPAGWSGVLRARLPDGPVAVRDQGGDDLGQIPAQAFGDPVVRRRDGAVSYHLAVVVDDAAAGVTDVVRGRDLATATATQVALQGRLGLPTPCYRHHFLLLEDQGRKLAKLHGSVGTPVLRTVYDGPRLCGWLAWAAGLLPRPEPCRPIELVRDFAWERVRRRDLLVRFDGQQLLAADDA